MLVPYEYATPPPNPEIDPLFAAYEHLNGLDRRVFVRKLCQRQKLSRFLYKYRALPRTRDAQGNVQFNPRSAQTLQELIVHSVLRLSSPAQFNDPFDMAAYMHIEGTEQQRRAKYMQVMRDNGVPEDQLENSVTAFMAIPEAGLTDALQKSLLRHQSTVGVACFADDPRSILMWNHYAENHNGVCLQFDLAQDLPTLVQAVRVDYSFDYPAVNWIDGFGNTLGAMLTRKYESWRYEGERRIILAEQAGKYLRFRPEALRAVILGCRTDDAVMGLIRSLLTERAKAGLPRVTSYRTVRHPRKYQLVVKHIP